VNDAALAQERRERGHAEFREFLDEKLSPVSLRKWSSDLKVTSQFAMYRLTFKNDKAHAFFGNFHDFGRVVGAIAVEEANEVAGAKPTNRGKMVSFGAIEFERPEFERLIGIKSFGHSRYNTPRAA
jgi:hypothetical protein